MSELYKYVDFDNVYIDETVHETIYDSPLTDNNFVKFLKDNNIYEKFMNNLVVPANMLCNGGSQPHSYILSAFSWEDTREGHDFWSMWNGVWDNNYC